MRGDAPPSAMVASFYHVGVMALLLCTLSLIILPRMDVSFLAEECDGEPVLGYMIEAAHLLPVLHEAVKAEQGIKLVSGARIESASFGDPLAVLTYQGGDMQAPLIVACDGAKSLVRGASDLRFEGWQYDAKVISATVQLAAHHKGAARQVFLPGGPLAVLPLKGNRANLIWTERAAVADALMALDDAGFEAELAKKAGDFVPGAKLAGARHAFRRYPEMGHMGINDEVIQQSLAFIKEWSAKPVESK